MDIETIVRHSTAAQTSYGIYVYRMGEKVVTQADAARDVCCRACGAAFIPAGTHQHYCNAACRKANRNARDRRRRAQQRRV